MDSLLELHETLKHSNVFLTGGAGVGKSYITNQIISSFRKNSKNVVPLGSTGVSAVNIGGFTVHSFFVFGISSNFEELAAHDKKAKQRLSNLKKILKTIDLIVIDEISMISTTMLDMIFYRLESMGYLGKILFVGDFFQLPPVQKFTPNQELFGEMLYAFESSAWQKFNLAVIELKEMKRTHDREFINILHKIRLGECDTQVIEYMLKLWNNQAVEELEPTYLYGRNLEVEQTNRFKLNLMPAHENIFFAQLETFGAVHDKRLESWKNLLPINEQLILKIGVPILFTVNKWGKFINGERGVLHAIEDDYLIVEKEEEFVRVERHTFDMLDMVTKPDGTIESVAIATLSQYPLKLAYAVTIHKSQGMSIDKLICNVDNIFAPSQFYVAISRAIDPSHLKIDYNRGDFTHYLSRVIQIDPRVSEYYKNIM